MNDELFIRFCNERHIRPSTREGYVSALKCYCNFCGNDLVSLLSEAKDDELNKINFNNRRVKERLISFRRFLFESGKSRVLLGLTM